MIAQTLEIRSIASPRIYKHVVQLIQGKTGHEVCMTVETMSESISDVYREIRYQCALKGLVGYGIHEVLCLDGDSF